MKRVPARLVRLLLEQSGRPIAPDSLRNWTRRGHITRTAEGYDLREVVAYLDRRSAAEDVLPNQLVGSA